MADAVHEELDPEQSVQISGSHGIQVGDGNTQYNYTLAVPSLGVQEVSTWWTKNVAPIHGAAPDGGNRARRRQDEAAALRSALEGDRNVVAVVGDLSTIEMKAFLAASLVDNPLAARTLFVNDPAGLAIGVRHVLA